MRVKRFGAAVPKLKRFVKAKRTTRSSDRLIAARLGYPYLDTLGGRWCNDIWFGRFTRTASSSDGIYIGEASPGRWLIRDNDMKPIIISRHRRRR